MKTLAQMITWWEITGRVKKGIWYPYMIKRNGEYFDVHRISLKSENKLINDIVVQYIIKNRKPQFIACYVTTNNYQTTRIPLKDLEKYGL